MKKGGSLLFQKPTAVYVKTPIWCFVSSFVEFFSIDRLQGGLNFQVFDGHKTMLNLVKSKVRCTCTCDDSPLFL